MGLEPQIKITANPELIAKADALLAAGLLDHDCWERLEEMSMGEVENIIKSMSVKKKNSRRPSSARGATEISLFFINLIVISQI